MSKIAKGVKKVFKGAKKFVKKIAKPVLIGAAIFFTAGIAAGGFAAFSGVSSLGGFFGAVGNTIGVGFQATMGSLGLSQGVSASMASASGVQAGTTLGTGTFAQALGLSAGPNTTAAVKAGMEATAGQGAGVLSKNALIEAGTQGSNVLGLGKTVGAGAGVTSKSLAALGGPTATGGAGAGSGGLLSTLGGAFKGMASTNTGQLMLAQGIMGGIQSYAQSEEAKKDRKRFMKSGVFGVARGEKYGQAFGPADIEQAAASIPGTAAYDRSQQQPQQGQTANATQPTQSPTPSGGGSLIGQTYEEGERQNQAQVAMQPGFSNPYNQNNQQGMPLLG